MTGLLSRQSNDATMDWTWYFLPFYRLNYKLIEKKTKNINQIIRENDCSHTVMLPTS